MCNGEKIDKTEASSSSHTVDTVDKLINVEGKHKKDTLIKTKYKT